MHSTGAHYFRYARDRKLKAQSLVYINFWESLGFYQEGAMRIARSHSSYVAVQCQTISPCSHLSNITGTGHLSPSSNWSGRRPFTAEMFGVQVPLGIL